MSEMNRLTLAGLHDRIGISKTTPGYGVAFGPASKAAFVKAFTNVNAKPLTEDDYAQAAKRLGVPIGHMKASKKVEAPRGAFDDKGRPSILFERHKFRKNTVPVGKFDQSNPAISGGPYGKGGYGAFSIQYTKLMDAVALDPEAGLRACSWGAFQVMGENYAILGYPSVWAMVQGLVQSEAAHLDTYVRFVEVNNLATKLRNCHPGNPASCIPFVRVYNGAGYAEFNYHHAFAEALRLFA